MKYPFSPDRLQIRKRLDRNLNPVEGNEWNLVYDESFSIQDTTADDITIVYSGTKYQCRYIKHFVLQVANSIDEDNYTGVGDFMVWDMHQDFAMDDKKKKYGDKYVERIA